MLESESGLEDGKELFFWYMLSPNMFYLWYFRWILLGYISARSWPV